MAQESDQHVQSFSRGLKVIKAFTGSPLTLSEVAARAELSPAATRRYLATLVELGYLAQEGSAFRVRSKLLELSKPYLEASDPVRKAAPILRRLSAEVRETTTLTQYSHGRVINLHACHADQELSIRVNVGSYLPVYCTAMGRTMLGMLDDAEVESVLESIDRPKLTPHTKTEVSAIMEEVRKARAQGYCLAEEEHTLGIRTLSVPVDLLQGSLVALSVPTPTARESRTDYVDRVLPQLLKAAEKMADKD